MVGGVSSRGSSIHSPGHPVGAPLQTVGGYAEWVGAAIAERAKKAGVEECYFDRGGFLFHGKVKALADAAREGGLKF